MKKEEKNIDKNDEKPIIDEGTVEEDVQQEAVDADKDAPAYPSDADLTAELEQAHKKAAEHLDRFQRTLAEFDNFRKRTVKEKASMYDDGVSDMANGLLPIVDNFERAFAAASEEDKKSPFFTGMQQIYKQLQQFMKDKGISEIEAVGAPFDPAIHSAIAHTDDDQYGENEVVEEMQKGYMLRDKVLRHSVVKVAN